MNYFKLEHAVLQMNLFIEIDDLHYHGYESISMVLGPPCSYYLSFSTLQVISSSVDVTYMQRDGFYFWRCLSHYPIDHRRDPSRYFTRFFRDETEATYHDITGHFLISVALYGAVSFLRTHGEGC